MFFFGDLMHQHQLDLEFKAYICTDPSCILSKEGMMADKNLKCLVGSYKLEAMVEQVMTKHVILQVESKLIL